jgi:5'-nucleotidase
VPRGADLVVVLAHAGSRCEAFDDPGDLSSCDLDGEVMALARQLPPGLVDHIVSGHKHNGIAHVVNGIAVTSAYSNAVAFDRVDFTFDRASGRIVDRRIFPPQILSTTARRYAGHPARPMPRVAAIAEEARATAATAKAEPLGPVLDAPLTRAGGVESGIGRLMTDAMLAESGADVAIYNVRGGIRADLAPGELTYGDVFQMSPFDNRLMVATMRGEELRRVVAHQAVSDDRRAGFAGMRVDVSCANGAVKVRMFRSDGREIGDADELRVAINDFLALGGNDILTPVIPAAGIPIPDDAPLVRDALVDWFRHRGARLSARDYLDPDDARWNLPDSSMACAAL